VCRRLESGDCSLKAGLYGNRKIATFAFSVVHKVVYTSISSLCSGLVTCDYTRSKMTSTFVLDPISLPHDFHALLAFSPLSLSSLLFFSPRTSHPYVRQLVEPKPHTSKTRL